MEFNQEWYGTQASIIEQGENFLVVDYGCQGRGVVTSYYLFAGIQICFLDFDTEDIMPSQTFNPDIIQITHCQSGRYECEFSNHTVSYLPEGYFSVSGTKYLPVSLSFPLKKCYAVSLVIDKQAISQGTHQMMAEIPVDLEHIGTTLDIERNWYLSTTPPKLQHLFSEIYTAKDVEDIGYFKIKAIELLYHIDQLTQNNGCDFKYFDKGQIQTTKKICKYMTDHLDQKFSLAVLTHKEKINLSVFHAVFAQVYGDTPYAYLKKYKMNFAAHELMKEEKKIGEIALDLGYSNASKFSKAFQSCYGILPKDYRKKEK